MIEKVLSIVIPVRIDSDNRLANLKTVLGWTKNIGCRLTLLESDKSPRLSGISKKYAHVDYVFVYDTAPVFHRTKYINELLECATTDIVAVWDSDVIISYTQVLQAVELIMREGCTIAYPYDGAFFKLSEELSSKFRRDLDIGYLQSLSLLPLFNRPSCGGVYFVDRELYLSVGGENENFIGWGAEDEERLRRVQILGGKANWISKGGSYHLYHEIGYQMQSLRSSAIYNMRTEFVKICCMDRDELKEYVSKWHQQV